MPENTRIQISREDFVKAFVDIAKPPQTLVTKLNKPPLCHLLSTYVIRPVACDENPYYIHHKNKQPVTMSQQRIKKNNLFRNDQTDPAIVDGDSSSDDEFKTVKTDKKRVKKPVQQVFPVRETAGIYPASDPSKVIVIDKKAQKAEEAPKEEPAPAKKEEVKAPVKPKAAEPVVKAEAPKPAPVKKPAAPKVESEIAKAMREALEGKPQPAAEAKPIEKKPVEKKPVEKKQPKPEPTEETKVHQRGGRGGERGRGRGARGGRGDKAQGETAQRPQTAKKTEAPVK